MAASLPRRSDGGASVVLQEGEVVVKFRLPPAPREHLTDVLRDPSRPAFLFGSTPPRLGTSESEARAVCAAFAARSAVLATDGFIVYDIQDESSRTPEARPFPFHRMMDASTYASFFLGVSGKDCVVYKSVVEDSASVFDAWLDVATRAHGHRAFNLVGAPTSSALKPGGLTLQAASARVGDARRRRDGVHFGCVAIPERHASKGTEAENMLRKMEAGAEWFITQGIFDAGPAVALINDYGDLCRARGLVPRKVILTFAPCGREKTMRFIKWLGMRVPADVEARIFAAASPTSESVAVLSETLAAILERTGASGVPLGINAESVSIVREEINAAHDLFRLLQARMLDGRGSPWAIKWFCVRSAILATNASAVAAAEAAALPMSAIRDADRAPGGEAASALALFANPSSAATADAASLQQHSSLPSSTPVVSGGSAAPTAGAAPNSQLLGYLDVAIRVTALAAAGALFIVYAIKAKKKLGKLFTNHYD